MAEELPAAVSRVIEATNAGFVGAITVDGDTVTARLAVSGGGFNGPSTFTFELAGDRVRSMRITG